MKHWEKRANGWVFISHASTDYESVKIVRNYLEENGFSALMFYLKSLEEKGKEENIKTLLEWEIAARNIFVICDSESARKSQWVKWETSYVKSLSNKIIKTIDIDELQYKKCTQLSKLDDLINRSTLYFMYSHRDNEKVRKIYDKLNSYGFKIFNDTVSIKLGDGVEKKIQTALRETVQRGAVLVFLSNNAKESKWFWKEKSLALESDVFIIPIVIDNVSITDFPAFTHLQYIDIRSITKSAIEKLIATINNNVNSNDSNDR